MTTLKSKWVLHFTLNYLIFHEVKKPPNSIKEALSTRLKSGGGCLRWWGAWTFKRMQIAHVITHLHAKGKSFNKSQSQRVGLFPREKSLTLNLSIENVPFELKWSNQITINMDLTRSSHCVKLKTYKFQIILTKSVCNWQTNAEFSVMSYHLLKYWCYFDLLIDQMITFVHVAIFNQLSKKMCILIMIPLLFIFNYYY